VSCCDWSANPEQVIMRDMAKRRTQTVLMRDDGAIFSVVIMSEQNVSEIKTFNTAFV
jgi:hypothetical protein